jgi:ElaB/YqjD/DUF883 family membrane-anchored ribosome-binding protein
MDGEFHMANNNRVPENIRHAGEDLQELGREIYRMADNTRHEVVQQLYDMADKIRSRADQTQGETRIRADQIAHNLEQAASHLNSRAVDQLEETTEIMRNNVWQTMGLFFLLGVLVGLLLSRRD